MVESTRLGDMLDISSMKKREESRMIQRFLAQASQLTEIVDLRDVGYETHF